MTTPTDNRFPDLDQRGRAAALAVRESVAHTSLIPTDSRLTGARNPRRWVIAGAFGLASAAAIGVFVVLRAPDIESQGMAPASVAEHFAPAYVPEGYVLFASDSSSSVPRGYPESDDQAIAIYERTDGALVAVVRNPDDASDVSGEVATSPAPPIHGLPATWNQDPGMSVSYLLWKEGGLRVTVAGQGVSQDDLHALAEAVVVENGQVALTSEGLTLRYGPGPMPLFGLPAPTDYSAVTITRADGSSDVGGGELELTIGRTVEPAGIEYFLRFAADGAEPTTLGGHVGHRLAMVEGRSGPHAFAWQDGDVTFYAVGHMGITEMDKVLASLGPVDDAAWQVMLQRTADLPDGLLVNDG